MPYFNQRHIILMALACGLFFWAFDAIVDSFLFREGHLFQQIFSPSERELWMRGFFLLFLATFTAFVCLIIRQRNRLEADLQVALADAAAERSKSEAIVAAIGDGVSIMDRDLKVLYQNQVHRDIIGGSFVGSRCYSVFDRRETACPGCPVVEAMQDGGIHSLVKALPPDSAVTHIEITASPLRDPSGTIIAGIEVVRDITAFMQAEEALAQKAIALEGANRELEAFSSTVSHDLRKPLTIIFTAAQVLRDECKEQTGLISYYIDTILEASQRMEELIDALQTLARISRSNLSITAVDLSSLVLEISSELQLVEPSRSVSWMITEGLTCSGDPHLLRVILENLLGNAWKYTRSQPTAIIQFGKLDTPRGEAFFVRDNGAGFDMARVGELFKPFARLHSVNEFPGTGIGLATVQRIVERHGGSVWAEGAVGSGAVFYFTLPEVPTT